MEVLFKKHVPELTAPAEIAMGDWIDLRAAEDVFMKKGDFAIISLGLSVKLPEGYEMLIAPRSRHLQKLWHHSGQQHRHHRRVLLWRR